ncbi:MAG TPA: hypothetical protein VK558_12275 [Patescibacteria group bacterium]|nr:hypothetical protein [Patescibacteria group bacterium]
MTDLTQLTTEDLLDPRNICFEMMDRDVIDELARRLAEAEAIAAQRQETFNRMWDADMRGIKRWQEAHPGNDLVWPDRSKLTEWLLDRATQAEAERDAAYLALDWAVSGFRADWTYREIVEFEALHSEALAKARAHAEKVTQ